MAGGVQDRKSNFELLRILAMLMIVSNHLANHGILHVSAEDAYALWEEGTAAARVTAAFLSVGGRIGVALFFMLSGFFLAYSERISLKSLKGILARVHFYGILMLLVYLGARSALGYHAEREIGDTVKASLFLPATIWWFALAYIVVLCLSPSINAILQALPGRAFMLAAIGYLWYFFYVPGSEFSYSIFIRGILFYMVGAYLRYRHETPRGRLLLYALCSLGLWAGSGTLSYFQICAITGRGDVLWKNWLWTPEQFQDYFLIPVTAAALFLAFRELRCCSALVNRIAGYTFGVYLLHEYASTRELLWGTLLRADTVQYASRWFPLFALADTAAVFLAGALVEMIREKLFACISRK